MNKSLFSKVARLIIGSIFMAIIIFIAGALPLLTIDAIVPGVIQVTPWSIWLTGIVITLVLLFFC